MGGQLKNTYFINLNVLLFFNKKKLKIVSVSELCNLSPYCIFRNFYPKLLIPKIVSPLCFEIMQKNVKWSGFFWASWMHLNQDSYRSGANFFNAFEERSFCKKNFRILEMRWLIFKVVVLIDKAENKRNLGSFLRVHWLKILLRSEKTRNVRFFRNPFVF